MSAPISRTAIGAAALALLLSACTVEDRAEADGPEAPAVATPAPSTRSEPAAAEPTPDSSAADSFALDTGEPGRVLFAHDFEGTREGNFPSRLDYIAGTMDVVRVGTGAQATRALHSGSAEAGQGARGCFTIPLPEVLPQQFTLAFRVRYDDPSDRVKVYLFSDGSDDTPDTRCTYPPPVHLQVLPRAQGLRWDGAESVGRGGLVENEWAAVALDCDGPYCKMRVNGEQVANVPRWDFPRADKLHVFLNGAGAMYLDDFRITQGGERSLYDDLESTGEISTTAIRFDVDSATIRPESNEILGELVAMMAEHPALRVEIEGHTDTDGGDAANQALSERRAAAVRSHLEANGVAGDRMTSSGRGEAEPAEPGDTPEAKAQNRRVVIRRR